MFCSFPKLRNLPEKKYSWKFCHFTCKLLLTNLLDWRCVTDAKLISLQSKLRSDSAAPPLWCPNPKIWGAKNFGGTKMFDFRRIILFCLEKRLSKHKMTIFSKHLGGPMAPLGPPWLRLWLNCCFKLTLKWSEHVIVYCTYSALIETLPSQAMFLLRCATGQMRSTTRPLSAVKSLSRACNIPNLISHIYIAFLPFHRLKRFTVCVSACLRNCMRTKQTFAQCKILLERALILWRVIRFIQIFCGAGACSRFPPLVK